MTIAVLTRPSARRPHPRPGLRRVLMAGASLTLHVAVLGAMILLAADEDHTPRVEPLAPIIQLEIERPPLPPQWRPRQQPPEPLRPVEPLTQPRTEPLVRPEPETQQPRPLPAPTPVPIATPTPTPAPTPPTPLPAVQAAPVPVPIPVPVPTPKPVQAPAQTLRPAPVSTPAPIVAPVIAPVAPVVAPAAPPVAAPQPVAAPPVAASAPSLPAPALPARRPAKDKDEDEAASGAPSAPAPRMAAPAPGGAPAPAASGVTDAWRFNPEGQAGRNARALRTSPAGCPSTGVLTQSERDLCNERFNARAAEGAERRITGSGNAERDARFAREGAREMQRYEQQRRPLSGGVGVLGPADCPGSNFGTGCAGAHLKDVPGVDMRQGARSTVNEGERRPNGLSASVGGLRIGGD